MPLYRFKAISPAGQFLQGEMEARTERLVIERLRDDARARLGAAFDIKQFHDVVLGSGPVTLPVLGRLVEEWVTQQA